MLVGNVIVGEELEGELINNNHGVFVAFILRCESVKVNEAPALKRQNESGGSISSRAKTDKSRGTRTSRRKPAAGTRYATGLFVD
jgi:hypothetical protein